MQQAGGSRWFEARYESVERKEDGKKTKKRHREERGGGERQREATKRFVIRAHTSSCTRLHAHAKGLSPSMVSLSRYFCFLPFLR